MRRTDLHDLSGRARSSAERRTRDRCARRSSRCQSASGRVGEATGRSDARALCGAMRAQRRVAAQLLHWTDAGRCGESEAIIGRWIAHRGRHDDVIVATKVGSEMGQGHKVLRKSYILQAVEESLRRLQVDCIDLYQSHWDDENTLFEEVLGAYEQLLRQGKVKAIGASNYSAARLAQALEVSKARGLPRYQTLQPLYNLYDRDSFEGELQALCARENIGVITYFSLAAGFLTGKYRSEADFAKSARGPGMKKYLNPRGMKILDALDSVAKRYDATPAQVSLAWLLARPGVTAPLASATNLD